MARSSSGSMTAPVGFDGLLRMTARVLGPAAAAIMRAVTLKPSFSLARTSTGRAPASRTASLKVGQCGEGMMASSPRSSRAWHARYSACLPPAVMATSESEKPTLKSFL
jgi:hypothetical protein